MNIWTNSHLSEVVGTLCHHLKKAWNNVSEYYVCHSYRQFSPIFPIKGKGKIFTSVKMLIVQNLTPNLCQSLAAADLNPGEATSNMQKPFYVQGIVRPPIGWSYLNSLSA